MVSSAESPSRAAAGHSAAARSNTGARHYARSIAMTTLIQAEIPDQLAQQAQLLVDHGWAASVESLVAESLRRYLESHQEVLTEQFIREDVAWALRGND